MDLNKILAPQRYPKPKQLTTVNEAIPVVGACSCTITFQTSLAGSAAPSANATVNFWVVNY